MNALEKDLSESKLSPAMQRIIRRADVEAEAAGTQEIGVVHVLVGMMQEGGNVAAQLLEEKEVTVEALRKMDFKR